MSETKAEPAQPKNLGDKPQLNALRHEGPSHTRITSCSNAQTHLLCCGKRPRATHVPSTARPAVYASHAQHAYALASHTQPLALLHFPAVMASRHAATCKTAQSATNITGQGATKLTTASIPNRWPCAWTTIHCILRTIAQPPTATATLCVKVWARGEVPSSCLACALRLVRATMACGCRQTPHASTRSLSVWSCDLGFSVSG